MAVQSSAFGSVTLTDADATKFKKQVRFGRPKAAAKESVARGTVLAKEFRSSGRELTIKMSVKGK